MKKQTVKLFQAYTIIVALAISAASLSVSKGATVFSDTFSQTPGTVLSGTSADIGGVWDETSGTSLAISSQNTVDTSGNGRLIFDSFAATLGAGEVITLSFDTLLPSNGSSVTSNFGWAGVSLFDNYVSGSNPGNEMAFLGKPSLEQWGVDGNIVGGQQGSGDTADVNHLVFTYAYDTGAWTYTSDSGSLSGTGTAGLALNGLRIGNGNGADINLDNLTVDISPVPEPSSMALVGAGMGLLWVLRRRRS